MNKIMINDLSFGKQLDRLALAQLRGGLLSYQGTTSKTLSTKIGNTAWSSEIVISTRFLQNAWMNGSVYAQYSVKKRKHRHQIEDSTVLKTHIYKIF